MPKTRKGLYTAIAEKIGGVRGERLRGLLAAPPTDPLLNQPIPDQRFEAEMKKLEQMPKSQRPGFPLSGDSWGFPN